MICDYLLNISPEINYTPLHFDIGARPVQVNKVLQPEMFISLSLPLSPFLPHCFFMATEFKAFATLAY